MCLRFVEVSEGVCSVREEFLSFNSTRDVSGETLANLITEELRSCGLSIDNIVAQGYDGAGNMSGKHRGVQARIKQLNPNTVYVHCRNHVLNLAICHTCRVPQIRNTYASLGEILYFICVSPKRFDIFLTNNPDGSRIKKFCETRWSIHSESITSFVSNFSAIAQPLDELQTDPDTKPSTKASGFFRTIHSFDFIVSLCLCDEVIKYLLPLSDTLQNEQCDLVFASKKSFGDCRFFSRQKK